MYKSTSFYFSFYYNLSRFWVYPNHVSIYSSAMSLKCYKSPWSGSSDRTPTTSDCLSSKAKYCAKITNIDSWSTQTTYSCKEEPQIEVNWKTKSFLGIDKSTIKETLACYNRTVDPKFDPEVELKGEYCFCSTDNCNDPNVVTSYTIEESIPLKVINLHLYLTIYSSIFKLTSPINLN